MLGINRSGEQIHEKLNQIRLGTGDELLVQGDRSKLMILDRENTLRLIRPVRRRALQEKQALMAVAFFFLPLILTAFNVLSLGVAVLIAAFLSFVTRIITPEEAYSSVEWRILILVIAIILVPIFWPL